MAAIDLIGEGQSFLGESPQVVKVRKVSVGVASTNDVVFDAQESLAVINVPANTLVLEVLSITNTAWTALVTLDVGDGADPNGFLATAKVAPTAAESAGILKSSDLPTASPRFYTGDPLYQ